MRVANSYEQKNKYNLIILKQMENYDTYKQAISEAEKAEGTAARKMEANNESIAYSINQLSVAWEEFAQKLEASGAVKLFFNILTDLVENLGQRLSQVVSLIVSMRSFKITTDLKRLADFFGFSVSEGKGRLQTGLDKIAGRFSPNRMTQQAEQEKEKYEQQRAGTYEEQSRNKVVNSNNRVVDALNRNVDALDRNSAAQRGESAPQASGATPSAASSNGQNTESIISEEKIPRNPWLGVTGSTVSIGAIKKARQEYEAAKQKSDPYAEGVFVGAHKQTADAKARYDQLRALRSQELKANWKQSAIRGVGTGLTAGLISGMSAEGDAQDKFVIGASSAVATGLLSAIPGVGAILGPILGPFVGEFVGKEINKLLKADEVARKERVQQAKDNLEAIKGISTSVTGLIDIRKKGDFTLWDADDWKQVNEYVESINKVANASEKFRDAIGEAITNIESMSEAELANIEAARIKYEAEQTYAAGEQDRYTLMQQISENQKKLNDEDASVVSKAKVAIASATAQIEEYSEALKKSYLESAFYASGVSSMSSIDISSATLDRVVMQVAREWEEKGGTNIFGASGELLDDARSDILSFLRQQSGYSSLFNNRAKDVFEIRSALSVFGEDEKLIENLRNLSKRRDQTDLVKELQKLGLLSDKYSVEQLNDLIDKINTADTTSISNIANGLNMTVEEFKDANKSGAFNWLTSGDILDGSDKFLEKMSSLSEVFGDLSKNASLSAENIQKVIKNYKFLLRGTKGEMSAENIAKNFGDMFINGINSQVAQAYIGMKSREAMVDRDIWSVFVSDETAMALFDEEQQRQVKAAKTYEDVINIMEETEGAKEKFWELAKGLIGEMDLFKEMRSILVEYQTSSYDAEISNLQSIKDALGDVNKQREKELELIKAKEALENASKEKVRVYREGVGFVYTTNQEAVQSAQDKVDELEMGQTQDDIQYQIDILNQQKSILENVAKNEELEALKDAVSGFFGNSSMDNLISAIFSINDKDFQDSLKKQFEEKGVSKSADVQEEVDEKKKQEAVAAYKDAIEQFEKNYEGAARISEGDVRYKDYIKRRNAAIENLTALSADAVDAGANPDDLAQPYQPDDVPMGIQNINVATNKKTYSYAASEVLANEDAINKEFGKSVYKKDDVIYYVLRESNGTYFVDRTIGGKNGLTYSDVKDGLKEGEVLIVDRGAAGWWDFGVYKGADGNIYTIGLEGGAGHIDIRDTPIRKGEWNFGGENSKTTASKYASGSLSSVGGPSLINENGLESIITPEGTITSLPAKSGIIPADLTRNLWALGEVAPNLIARLGGSNLQTNNNVATNDNSINVDTLNATFNTTKDFDTQKFWMAVKNETILTKNNH